MCNVLRGIKCAYKWNERHVLRLKRKFISLSENQMHLKRETQSALCVSNAKAKSQTRKSMYVNQQKYII